MSQAIPPWEGQEMEPDHNRGLELVNGGQDENAKASLSEVAHESYPDFTFDLSEPRLFGNNIVPVQPQRRLIRIINTLADACPDEMPPITSKHFALNHLKRVRNKQARGGGGPIFDVEHTTEILRESNHPIAQLFDKLDELYGDDDRLSHGLMRVLKEDVLIIADHVDSGRQLGRTALDTSAQTE